MPKKQKSLNLGEERAHALIRLTNSQFEVWRDKLLEAVDQVQSSKLGAGASMNYWFVLSTLAMHGDKQFRMRKKDAFSSIPNLSTESVRKIIAKLELLGFVETVKSKGQIDLSLAPAGQKAIAETLSTWLKEFGKLQRRDFPDW